MIPPTRVLLLTLNSFLLLLLLIVNAQAQKPDDRIKRRTDSVPPFSIRGKIRWKKEYGVLPLGPAVKEASVFPCGQYFVAALKNVVPSPGRFGRLETVAYTPDLPNKLTQAPDEGDYHVCEYIIPNLPKNTNLLIMAGMGGVLLLPNMDDDPYYWTNPWIGGSQNQPPSGSQRTFIGNQNVTLTDNMSRMTIDFEIVYRPIPKAPR